MSSAFGRLFGERERVQQPTAFGTLPGFAQAATQEAVKRGQRLSEQSDIFAPSPLTPQQLEAIQRLGQAPVALTPEAFQEQLSVFQDPFEEQVVQSAIEDIQEQAGALRSDIGQRASAAGAFGGARQGILEAELNRALLRDVGDVAARTRSQGFQQATRNALERLQRQENLQRQSALDLLAGGGILQQQATAQQQAPIEALNFLAGLSQQVPAGGGQTSFQQNPGLIARTAGGFGNLGQIASSLGGLASGFGTFFSDERLKEDIEKVDVIDGINIYEFNYKDDPGKKFRGVLAQEIIDDYPDAVDMSDSGYYQVDYSKINIPFMEVI